MVVIVVVVIVCVVRAIEMIVIVGMVVVVPGARLRCRENRETPVAFRSHVRKPRRESFEHSHSFKSHEPSFGLIHSTISRRSSLFRSDVASALSHDRDTQALVR